MKKITSWNKTVALFGVMALAFSASGQALIRQAQIAFDLDTIGCGSHKYMEHMETKNPGYLELSDELLERAVKVKSHQKSAAKFIVPVVFHVVYNNDEENLPDSVIEDQIRILNESYRRTTADTAGMRADFKDIVGDTRIEFELAKYDPQGNPTNGITRTKTDITHFGGVLPYAAGQNAEILKWINDSLFINYYRIADDGNGGHSAWDDRVYLNVWVGDLRILEPKVNNFEEILYFGLATPPVDHENWPDTLLGNLKTLQQGVLIHYLNIGSNNPNEFKAPYNIYNGIVNTGKILVHEAGHYLGLRHIWGDGNCDADDFIHDTPRSNAASQFSCNTANSCVDTIQGKDLPNMVENFMDYSGTTCQSSFTHGQINVMHNVLLKYRAALVSVDQSLESELFGVSVYPNPTNGRITVEADFDLQNATVRMTDINGTEIDFDLTSEPNRMNIMLDQPNGIYFLTITTINASASFKVMKW